MYQSSQVPADNPMTALRLSFALEDNPDASINAEIAEISLEEQVQRRDEIEEKIRSRCCGLLEIYRPNLSHLETAKSDIPQATRSRKYPYVINSFVNPEVHFLHKSVIDFLEKPAIWEELHDFTSSSGFDPNVSLISASLREIKSAPKELDQSMFPRLPFLVPQ
ncbi:uncharacterized protein BDZ99DRAFT_524564 [Mytilinidion resinicola]|uniref:DUF7791 domain-containing protein n=1 Tax=Mytilinidion resinicola TaxID=574789 RepID=A0A6A6YAF0_9PEZI|nr:uncharacterized protein BDZ99DRAFT_524564 [Mytilinidion resinicola]KAF2805599.1 hypothetical protein BDZ99DRAFT_524564 [Mytilinidion resinicola]